jgi:hypothetical protein
MMSKSQRIVFGVLYCLLGMLMLCLSSIEMHKIITLEIHGTRAIWIASNTDPPSLNTLWYVLFGKAISVLAGIGAVYCAYLTWKERVDWRWYIMACVVALWVYPMGTIVILWHGFILMNRGNGNQIPTINN